MRVLGIDLGLKRTGMAISDELGLSIKLLPVLRVKNRKELLEKILTIADEYLIKVVLIGHPEAITLGSKALKIRVLGLKDSLLLLFKELNLNIKIVLWDETLSSKKALEGLLISGVSKKKRQTHIDSNSAAVMVEEFLSSYKNYE